MRARVTCVVVLGAVLGCGGANHPSKESPMRERSSPGGSADNPSPAAAATRPGTTTPTGTTRPTDRPVGPGLPAGWEMVPTATFTATQQGGAVTIRAKGENPTAGYETKFMQSMLRIWPPQYSLIRKAPAGPAAQVVTPFEVTTSFRAAEPVTTVVVRDGMGRHEVKVGG